MKLQILLFCCLALFGAAVAHSFEIVPGNFEGPYQGETRPCKYVRLDKDFVLLPQRSSYREIITNAERTIWALNYHETSNFDSVDLVLSHGERVFILLNVWNNLEGKLKEEQLLARYAFHHLNFSVMAIEGRRLRCQFHGVSNEGGETDSKFEVIVKTRSDGVDFELAK